MSKIILLNGPALCGKNTAVDHIKSLMHSLGVAVMDRRCKDRLFELTRDLFCLTKEEFYSHYNNRATKETPNEAFSIDPYTFNKLAPILGKSETLSKNKVLLSVREALIYVSEVICKPAFGSAYFGECRADAIRVGEFAIDDSCGFDDEIAPVIDKLGMDNIMLIRIHGRGNFKGDSRNYISEGVVENTIDLYNDGTQEEFLKDIAMESEFFYNGKLS